MFSPLFYPLALAIGVCCTVAPQYQAPPEAATGPGPFPLPGVDASAGPGVDIHDPIDLSKAPGDLGIDHGEDAVALAERRVRGSFRSRLQPWASPNQISMSPLLAGDCGGAFEAGQSE